MDKRTIVVKGVGTATAKPDFVELSLTLFTDDKEYGAAMAKASDEIAELKSAVAGCGFEESALKTLDFNVDTLYDSVRDERGDYRQVFAGYRCVHRLKLSFDFVPQRLSDVLTAVGSCRVNPELSIRFTVKDMSAVSEKLIESAAENARAKAEVLCRASGVRLGELLSISYDWTDVAFYSQSEIRNNRIEPLMAKAAFEDSFEPDDVRASDTATFVWSIE